MSIRLITKICIKARPSSPTVTITKLCACKQLQLWDTSSRCFNILQYKTPRYYSSSPSYENDDIKQNRQLFQSDPEVKVWMNQLAHQFSEHPGRKEIYQYENLNQRKNTGLEVTANNLNINNETLREESESYAAIEDFSYQDCEDEAENETEEYMSQRCIPFSTERGKTGPFDVEELVTLLEKENGVNIRVLDIAPEIRFVNHMVIVTGKSLRHMRAMAASIEWLYKKKRESTDRPFKLEGRHCKDWFAMDLGNIAVHIFMSETRQHYDLETLWTLGPEFDDPRHYADNETSNLSPAELLWQENAHSVNTASTDESTQDRENQHAEKCP